MGLLNKSSALPTKRKHSGRLNKKVGLIICRFLAEYSTKLR